MGAEFRRAPPTPSGRRQNQDDCPCFAPKTTKGLCGSCSSHSRQVLRPLPRSLAPPSPGAPPGLLPGREFSRCCCCLHRTPPTLLPCPASRHSCHRARGSGTWRREATLSLPQPPLCLCSGANPRGRNSVSEDEVL